LGAKEGTIERSAGKRPIYQGMITFFPLSLSGLDPHKKSEKDETSLKKKKLGKNEAKISPKQDREEGKSSKSVAKRMYGSKKRDGAYGLNHLEKRESK